MTHVLSLLLKVKNTVNGTGRIVCMRGQYRSNSFLKRSDISGRVSTILKICEIKPNTEFSRMPLLN